MQEDPARQLLWGGRRSGPVETEVGVVTEINRAGLRINGGVFRRFRRDSRPESWLDVGETIMIDFHLQPFCSRASWYVIDELFRADSEEVRNALAEARAGLPENPSDVDVVAVRTAALRAVVDLASGQQPAEPIATVLARAVEVERWLLRPR